MRLNKDIIEDSNRKELSLHEQGFDFLSNSFIRKNVDVTNILKKISDFQVAIPSWALGAGGGLIMMNAIENGDIKVNKGTKEDVQNFFSYLDSPVEVGNIDLIVRL